MERTMDKAREACRSDDAFNQAWRDMTDALRPPQAASPDQTPPPTN